jgi:hypothetical protein
MNSRTPEHMLMEGSKKKPKNEKEREVKPAA